MTPKLVNYQVLKLKISFFLGKYASLFQAEVYALIKTMHYVGD